MPYVKKKELELSVENYLVAQVGALGGICEKVQVVGRRGFFDRLVVLPHGRVLFVEVKRPRGGVMSPHQKSRYAQYRALGCAVAIVRNQEDIDQLLAAEK